LNLFGGGGGRENCPRKLPSRRAREKIPLPVGGDCATKTAHRVFELSFYAVAKNQRLVFRYSRLFTVPDTYEIAPAASVFY
jgi:hypothetical protein